MEAALKEIRRRYEQDSHINGYCVMDTFNNGYQAALLDVMEILEGYPSALEQKTYMDFDEVESQYVANYEHEKYFPRIKQLAPLMDEKELYAITEHWYCDCQIGEEAQELLNMTIGRLKKGDKNAE